MNKEKSKIEYISQRDFEDRFITSFKTEPIKFYKIVLDDYKIIEHSIYEYPESRDNKISFIQTHQPLGKIRLALYTTKYYYHQEEKKFYAIVETGTTVEDYYEDEMYVKVDDKNEIILSSLFWKRFN